MPSQTPTNSSLEKLLRYVLPLATGLIILGLGWWVWLSPMWFELKSTQEFDTLTQAKAQVQAELDTLAKLRQDYGGLSLQDEQRLKLVLPQGKDIPNLLAQAEGLVKQSGFNILMLSVGTVVEPKGSEGAGTTALSTPAEAAPLLVGDYQLAELQLNLTLGPGSYEKFKQFLAKAQQSLRLLDLTSFTFRGDKADAGYAISFRTPYLALRQP